MEVGFIGRSSPRILETTEDSMESEFEPRASHDNEMIHESLVFGSWGSKDEKFKASLDYMTSYNKKK